VPGIRQKTPDTWAEVSPQSARERGIQSGLRVQLNAQEVDRVLHRAVLQLPPPYCTQPAKIFGKQRK
jgi:predicted molibdopterin-dependent oxidoreductase YjgC